MARIRSELVGSEIITTKYETGKFIVPDSISQERKIVSVIRDNLDTNVEESPIELSRVAVPREDFLYKLLHSCGKEASDRYKEYCSNLYSREDIVKGITWAEVAYLLYYVGGLERNLQWSSIKPAEGYRVCVLQEVVEGKKYLNEKLAFYKNRLDMEDYIRCIVKGKRFIPLPLYCAFTDLINNKDVKVELSHNMMFRKLSREEFEGLFD